MAFAIRTTLEAIQSHVNSSGYVSECIIGEYTSAPMPSGLGIAASVIPMREETVMAFGATTRELHTVLLRLYRDWLSEPASSRDLPLEEAKGVILANLKGDLDLEGAAMSLDIAGMHSGGYSADWGRVEIGSTIFRVIDMTLPVIVDDSTAISA